MLRDQGFSAGDGPMKGRRFDHLLGSIGVLRHPCDLDLLVFFHRHPRAILTSDRLAAYVGYDLNQLARSLDLLTEAGLLERSQNPTHAARLYVLKTPATGWLTSVLDIASTREGRHKLLQTMREAIEREPSVEDDGESSFFRCRAKKVAAR
jgi:predicted transcriptional regulator